MTLIRNEIELAVPDDCHKEFNLDTKLVDICLKDHVSIGLNVVKGADLCFMVSNLESVLEISIPDDEFFSFKTVGDIFFAFRRKLDSREHSKR